ncbi:MAG TPA: NYN domain-containing protein [Candidatus Portnoybacteria bacterium]|nr:NYN domain-containing protein [Candidatus Portnoybacteria bacterium]
MPVIKHKDQRVGVFIDVPNLYHSAKNLYHAKVNFKEVLKTALDGRHLIRALAYSIRTEGGEEQAFIDALTKSGIEVKLKDLQIFPGGMKKGDWDVGLAVDAIKLGAKLDAIVLATGDGDFVPLIEFLKVNFGCQVEVIAFGRSASGQLKEIADDFIDLGNNKKYFIN